MAYTKLTRETVNSRQIPPHLVHDRLLYMHVSVPNDWSLLDVLDEHLHVQIDGQRFPFAHDMVDAVVQTRVYKHTAGSCLCILFENYFVLYQTAFQHSRCVYIIVSTIGRSGVLKLGGVSQKYMKSGAFTRSSVQRSTTEERQTKSPFSRISHIYNIYIYIYTQQQLAKRTPKTPAPRHAQLFEWSTHDHVVVVAAVAVAVVMMMMIVVVVNVCGTCVCIESDIARALLRADRAKAADC